MWSAWGAWDTCSVSCGGGNQEKMRTKSPPAENGGTDCVGSDTESQTCNDDISCPGTFNHYFCYKHDINI